MHKAGEKVAGNAGGFCVGYTGHWASEQTMFSDPSGRISLGLDADGGAGMLSTTDEGHSWTKSTPMHQPNKPLLDPAMGWLERDPDTGRVFASSMLDPNCVGLPGDALAFSDDDGRTWSNTSGQMCNGGDWGKTFIGKPATVEAKEATAKSGYPNVVYHCSGGTFQNTRFCWRSYDGGRNFERTGSNAFTMFGDDRDPTRGPQACTDRPDFHLLAGQATTTPDGQIYLVLNACGRLQISHSADGGDTWNLLDVPPAKMRAWARHGDVDGFLEPFNAGYPNRPKQPFMNWYGPIGMSQILGQSLQSDSEGNLYLTWIDATDNNLHYSVSRDRGASWGDPQQIAAPGVAQSVLPAIAVDEPGHVAVAYFGTRDTDMANSRWNGYLTESTDALAPEPTFRTGETDPANPIMPNGVGEPVESPGVTFAPDGSAWGAFTHDTCVKDNNPVPPVQCDADFTYSNTRYRGVVAHLVK